MTKTVKLVLIIAASVVVLGLIVGCVGVFLFGGLKNTGDFEAFTESYSSAIGGIRVDVDTADVNVYPVSGDEIKVLYYDNENHYFDITLQDNTLVIIRRQTHQTWFKNWFNWSTNDYELEIGIPASFSGDLNIEATTGDLDISKLALSTDVSFETTTGDIRLSDITCSGSVHTSVTTGGTRLMSVNISGDLTAVGSTGDIKGDSIFCRGSFTADHSTGGINITGLTAKTVKATASTGDIKISQMTVSDSIYIEATTGDVRCSVTDGVENYTISSNARTGDNNLQTHAAYGTKSLEVYTTTGDIDFDFNK